MTAIVPQKDAQADLTSLLRKLSDQKAVKASVSPAGPAELVEVTDSALQALSALSELLKTVELPSERRDMTPEELEAAGKLADTAKKASEGVTKAVAEVKKAFFNHLDVQIENDEGAEPGLADYDVDEKGGFYLVADDVFVPGLGKRLTRELSENAPTVTAKDLHTLWQSGVLSREKYYKATRALEVPREIDPDGLLELLQDEDNREIIGAAITPGKVTASFHVRAPKKA